MDNVIPLMHASNVIAGDKVRIAENAYELRDIVDASLEADMSSDFRDQLNRTRNYLLLCAVISVAIFAIQFFDSLKAALGSWIYILYFFEIISIAFMLVQMRKLSRRKGAGNYYVRLTTTSGVERVFLSTDEVNAQNVVSEIKRAIAGLRNK